MTAPVRFCFLISALFLVTTAYARAADPDETLRTPAALAALEHRAETAAPRERCALYTELAHSLMEIAGKQLSDGDDASADATLSRIDMLTLKIKTYAVADAKRLQNAEMLLEHTARRLSDMMHTASTEQRATMKTTLDHLNQVHTQMLAVLFAQ